MNATGVPVALYHSDGSVGAAIGAGIGSGIYKNASEAFSDFKPIQIIEPTKVAQYDALYAGWKNQLEKQLLNN